MLCYLKHGVLYGGEGTRAWARSLGLGGASVALAEDSAGGDDHHVAAAAKFVQSRHARVGIAGGFGKSIVKSVVPKERCERCGRQ